MNYVPRQQAIFHRVFRFPETLWQATRIRATQVHQPVRSVVQDALDAELDSLIERLRDLGFQGEDVEPDKLVRLPVDERVVDRINDGRRRTGVPATQLLRMCLGRYLAT